MSKSTAIVCHDDDGQACLVAESDLIDRVGVYAIVQNIQNQILLVNNTSGGWELPGGGQQNSETFLQTLNRELEEETGLTIAGTPYLFQEVIEYYYSHKYQQGWRSHRRYYLIDTQGEITRRHDLDDVTQAKYFSPTTIAHLKIEPTARVIIHQFLAKE